MTMITVALVRVAHYGTLTGALLLAIAIFILNEHSPLGITISVCGLLLLWAKPLIGSVRGFRSGLRGEPAERH
jgi:hypothetical protein